MATQYDPIAKDESLNTTEATPRNIADVLAEGLKGIEDALPPTYTEGDGINISNDEISVDTTFTEASTRANIASGESFATILGKIKKFFADLKSVAFSGSYNDLSDQPTIPTDFVSKANGGTFGGDVTIATSSGDSRIILGSGSSVGQARFINGNYRTSMYPQTLTANRTVEIPDKSGTMALTTDLPQITSGTISGSLGFTIIWTKYGRVVSLTLSNDTTNIPIGTNEIATLPDAIKPQNTVYANCFVEVTNRCSFIISPSTGKISCRNPDGSGVYYVSASMTYISAS